jgi:hypothetical protein
VRTDAIAGITDTLTIKGDGTVTAVKRLSDNSTQNTDGTYTIAGSEMTLNVPPATVTAPFYVNATALGLEAMTPEGSHQGIVGTWDTDFELELVSQPHQGLTSTRFTFNADNTAHAVSTLAGMTEPSDGTWKVDKASGNFVVTMGSISMTYQLLDDHVLSPNVYLKK